MKLAQLGILSNNWIGDNIVIDLANVTGVKAVGDSIMEGYNATNRATQSFAYLHASASGLTLSNIGLSSSKALHCYQLFKDEAFTRLSTMLLVNVGLNDITAELNNAVNKQQFKDGINSIIGLYLASTKVASGSASVTRSGTFVSPAFTALGSVMVSGSIPGASIYASTTVANSYYEYTFTGTAIGFAYIATSTAFDYSIFEIYIDGVLYDTVDPSTKLSGDYDNYGAKTRAHLHYNIWGLANTSHTIKIICTENKVCGVDFFYQPVAPASCQNIIFQEIPYMDDTYYGVGHPNVNYQNGSKAKSDEWSGFINEIMGQFRNRGYKASYAAVNSYYDRSIGLATDFIHPNDKGHYDIANGLVQLTRLSTPVTLATPTITASVWTDTEILLGIPATTPGAINYYDVQYDTVNTFTNPTSVQVSRYSSTSSVITGLTANTLYYFRMRAVSVSPVFYQTSSWSSTVSATTMATISQKLSDTFTGTTIDTGEWTLTNPNTPNPTISQNGEIRLKTNSGGGTSAFYANKLESVDTIGRGYFEFDIVSNTLYTNAGVVYGLSVDSSNRISLFPTSLNKQRLFIVVGGSIVYTYDPGTIGGYGLKWRIVVDGSNNISAYYYFQDKWWQFGTTQTFNIGASKKGHFSITNNNSVTATAVVDNAVLYGS
jgi:hypothetical protein